jgi:hypothetical protein
MSIKSSLRQSIISIHQLFFWKHYYNIIKLIEPGIFYFTKKGFGKVGDGTYILPQELLNELDNKILLSFGISDDISFEKDFHSEYPNCKIFAFDPTVNSLPEENPNINFNKIGLSGKTNINNQLFTITDIFKKINLGQQNNYIFKIDIEGWEWGFLNELTLLKINIPIITIELHFFPLIGKGETLLLPFRFFKKLKILKKIKDEFYIYHIHANNYN